MFDTMGHWWYLFWVSCGISSFVISFVQINEHILTKSIFRNNGMYMVYVCVSLDIKYICLQSTMIFVIHHHRHLAWLMIPIPACKSLIIHIHWSSCGGENMNDIGVLCNSTTLMNLFIHVNSSYTSFAFTQGSLPLVSMTNSWNDVTCNCISIRWVSARKA